MTFGMGSSLNVGLSGLDMVNACRKRTWGGVADLLGNSLKTKSTAETVASADVAASF